MISDLIHLAVHKHTYDPTPTGVIRRCRNRLTGRTRWSFAAAGRRPVWVRKSVVEVGRLNVAGRAA